MTHINEKQANELLEDLALIKKAIQKNTPVLQQIALDKAFWLLSLFGGIAIILISLLFDYFIRQAGSFDALAGGTKIFLFSLIGLFIIITGTYKWIQFTRSARAVEPAITGWGLFKELHASQILISLHIPVGLLMLFLTFYSIAQGHPELSVPIISIGVGILWNAYGSLFRTKQFYVGGYWMMITGAISLLLSHVSPFINLSYSVGMGLIIFGIASWTTTPRGE
ncbi:MAG: hypothetical protein GF401_07810 [Chitinivibrionales bacterium]|nr:hypothetical protein [Chitinivibrionales bacterium]